MKIGELPSVPSPAVYTRSDGRTYLKINAAFHVSARRGNGLWLGDGGVEQLDPDEEVRIIDAT